MKPACRLLAATLGCLALADAASAACLPTETAVGTACQSRIIDHFTSAGLLMTGVPTAGERLPPPPPATYDVGTLAMAGLGGPPVYDIGTLVITGNAGAARP